ncbi:MAG: hypothetical protein NTV68_11210 [Methanomicrobiales archaeon]|nr:hypothetical protein [Methanomicrobiales archaeon]
MGDYRGTDTHPAGKGTAVTAPDGTCTFLTKYLLIANWTPDDYWSLFLACYPIESSSCSTSSLRYVFNPNFDIGYISRTLKAAPGYFPSHMKRNAKVNNPFLVLLIGLSAVWCTNETWEKITQYTPE